MRIFGASVRVQDSPGRWWDGSPMPGEGVGTIEAVGVAINSAKAKAFKTNAHNLAGFDALASLPGMRELVQQSKANQQKSQVKTTNQKPTGANEMAIDTDDLAQKLVARGMAALGFEPDYASLEDALPKAHSLDEMCLLGIVHDVNWLRSKGVKVFVTNGFSPELRLAAGFKGGSFATRLKSSQDWAICLDTQQCYEIAKTLSLTTSAVSRVALAHEYGHILASIAGYGMKDEQLAWDLGEKYGYELIKTHDIALQKVKRHLLLQQAAA